MAATMDKELIVVGGGVAGCTAAMYAKRYNLDVILLEKAAPGGQTASASEIENYPGFPDGISGFELAERVHQQAEKTGVEFVQGNADRLERDDSHWVVKTSVGDIRTVAVIAATGASPRRLKVPGEMDLYGKGVSYCATCDGMFYRGKTVAVIGGGNTAVDEAVYLSDICEKVYLVHRRDRLRAEDTLQQRAFKRPNIDFIWDSVVSEVVGPDFVTGLRIKNVKTEELRNLAVDGVFVAIGHDPQTGWLEGVVELNQGYVIADLTMATSAPGIFVAGDTRDTPLRQITTAVGDAAIAAFSAYQYVLNFRD